MTDPQVRATKPSLSRPRKKREEADLEAAEQALLAIPDPTAEQTLPAIPDEYAREGMEDIDIDDLTLPRVRVIQPTSKLEGERGHFHYNLTNECMRTINAVLLKVTKTRVYWDPDDLAAPPCCASDDNKQPRAEHVGKFTPTGLCKDCAHVAWGEDRTPPDCRLTYTFLAADRDNDDTPFLIGLAGSSAKHAKKLLSTFFLKSAPLWARPVVINSMEVKNDKGRFYEVLIVPNGGEAFDWRPYRAMYLALQAATITADTEPTLDTDGAAKEGELPF